jgi:two-component system sensor histidine kinase MprB
VPGSGLGLAIVRDLAEIHGGRVALEDAPGGGLRVRLELPAPAAASLLPARAWSLLVAPHLCAMERE